MNALETKMMKQKRYRSGILYPKRSPDRELAIVKEHRGDEGPDVGKRNRKGLFGFIWP